MTWQKRQKWNNSMQTLQYNQKQQATYSFLKVATIKFLKNEDLFSNSTDFNSDHMSITFFFLFWNSFNYPLSSCALSSILRKSWSTSLIYCSVSLTILSFNCKYFLFHHLASNNWKQKVIFRNQNITYYIFLLHNGKVNCNSKISILLFTLPLSCKKCRSRDSYSIVCLQRLGVSSIIPPTIQVMRKKHKQELAIDAKNWYLLKSKLASCTD